MHNQAWVKVDKKNYQFICKEFLCLLNKAWYEEKRSKFSKDQKKVITIPNEIYCIIDFLSFLVATLEKHNFFSISKSMFLVFAVHELLSTAKDPDYGLFIGYQMPADKHEGLNACLYLLPKNVNNFAKATNRSAHHMHYRSNTEYYESTYSLMLSLQAPCLTQLLRNSVSKTVWVMLKRL